MKQVYTRDPLLLQFYNSSRWRKTRAYIKTLRLGICEQCGGLGEHVHHVIELTTANMNTDLAIDPENLRLLCRVCHNNQRYSDLRGDVVFDEKGDLNIKPPRG